MTAAGEPAAYVVTGGTRGLGFASARRLIDDGARVLVTGRSAAGVEAAVAALGERSSGLVADNGDPETAALVVDAAMQRFGRLDGVLISVGGPAAGSVLDTPDDAWTSAFESVFLGAVRIARAAAGAMTDGGSLVFVLSSSVRSPLAGLAVSNGLRPGLAMVAKTLSDELGPRGIRVNGLLPGRLDTERVAELDALSGDPVAARARMVEQIPLGRYGRPEEFAEAALFLLSPRSSFVTGVMLPVDGGLLRSI